MSTSDETVTNGQAATMNTDAGTIDPGLFAWWELSTTDPDGAKKFYNAVFGWTYRDDAMANGFVYTSFLYDGKSVAACYQQMPEQTAQGVPSNWMSYVKVASADESAGKVTAAGGTVIMPPMDAEEHVRMAICQDPSGAFFGLMQPKRHTGAQLINAVGGVCWTELMSTNMESVRSFYNALFGWVPETNDMGGGMQYTQFKLGSHTAAGAMQISPEMGPIPSHWCGYVTVENCDATVSKVTENGGQMIVPAMDIPGVGRFAKFRDPQGAVIAFIQLLPM
jgi:predicted enzyme related to lactoylglutathione lyase